MRRFLTFLTLAFLLVPAGGFAQDGDALRTANYFLLSGTTLDDAATFATLARYDLLVLPAEAQVYNPTFAANIRAAHPGIILLAYVPSVSWNSVWQDSLHAKLRARIQDQYWLRSASGGIVSIWPGTEALDLTSGWRDALADFVVEDVLASGYWDGVFYDEVSDSISWTGSLALASGSNDVDSAWRSAYTSLFSTTRSRIGSDIMITNGSSLSAHRPYVNGRMFESFPTPWESGGSWSTQQSQSESLAEGAQPPVVIYNSNTDNSGNQYDYREMRFGLSSALLSGAYFGFDFGTESHAQLWWYDEYDMFLGTPTESSHQIDGGIWERDFAYGKALVNPTSSSQTISLDGDYEKLHGTQDPSTNNGSIVSRVTIGAQDGLLLLRPLENIFDAPYRNGTFARVFSDTGAVKRNGFFAYASDEAGASQIVEFDVNNDGERDRVIAVDNEVIIKNSNGSTRARFYPYTSAYKGGVNIAVGDIENDGSVEIVTGTEDGGGAHIRVFNGDGVLINPGFFAYAKDYRGGTRVAIGDLNGDNIKEIITGAAAGGGPHVRVFKKDGTLINPGFFAFDSSLRGGVHVATGDTNNDNVDEIITGAGDGQRPEVRVYDRNGKLLIPTFTSGDTSSRDGVEVSASDLDGDGRAEILTFSTDVFTLTNLGF